MKKVESHIPICLFYILELVKMSQKKGEEKDVWIHSDEICKVPYDGLINVLVEKCDEFILVVPYQTYCHEYRLGELESEEILARAYGNVICESRQEWDKLSEESKKELRSFEEFIETIETRRKRMLSEFKMEEEFSVEYQGDMQDIVSDAWRIYSNQDFFFMLEVRHGIYRKWKEERDIIAELRLPENRPLMDNHIESILTHRWHSTTSSELMIEHHFECNSEILEWLKGRNGIFDFGADLLDDPCFMKNGEVVLSVCVHEGLAWLNKTVFDG